MAARTPASPTAVRVWTESLTPGSKRHFRDLLRFHAYVQWIAYSQWLPSAPTQSKKAWR